MDERRYLTKQSGCHGGANGRTLPCKAPRDAKLVVVVLILVIILVLVLVLILALVLVMVVRKKQKHGDTQRGKMRTN